MVGSKTVRNSMLRRGRGYPLLAVLAYPLYLNDLGPTKLLILTSQSFFCFAGG